LRNVRFCPIRPTNFAGGEWMPFLRAVRVLGAPQRSARRPSTIHREVPMIVVRFKVQSRPDKTEQLMAALENVIVPSRQLDGCIEFDIARCLDDPNSFVATEVFEDRAALERQEGQTQVGTVLSMLPDVVAAEPVATIYDVSSAAPHGG
jgi:quinol monooxygenase YgiN